MTTKMKDNAKIVIVAIALGLAATVNAHSEIEGNLTSGITSGLTAGVISVPVASPVAGVYTSAQNVSLSASGATSIRYSTDGVDPTCSTGTVYSSPISVSSTVAIEAISCYPNNNASTVAVFLYSINTPPAQVNQNTGSGGGGGGSTTSNQSSSGVDADINNDGKVDILDLVPLMAGWNQTSSNLPGDLNSDGKVDILDFVILMANWTN